MAISLMCLAQVAEQKVIELQGGNLYLSVCRYRVEGGLLTFWERGVLATLQSYRRRYGPNSLIVVCVCVECLGSLFSGT